MPPIRRPVQPKGPYKRYLTEQGRGVPRTSAWRRELEDAVDPPEVQEQQQLENQEDLDSSDSGSGMNVSGGLSDHEDDMNDAESDGEDVNPQDEEAGDHNDSSSGSSESDNEQDIDNDAGPRPVARDSDDEDEEEEEDNREFGDGEGNLGHPLPNDGNEDEEDLRGPPLYHGCPLSSVESELLIMSYVIRWGLEEKSIDHLLQLIDCHLPCSVMGSQYLYLKNFKVPDLSVARFTCSECCHLLPKDFFRGLCENCGEVMESKILKDSGNFFVELSVTKQLRSILENETLFSKLRRACDQNDVITGKVFRTLRERGVLGANDITLQWNTDGVSPYNSSKIQVWPIQACINELPYSVRRQNMILCGLYFGKKKPDMNSFLKPFVEELNLLHTNGFLCKFPGEAEETTVKVHTILGSVDSVARPILQGIKQFNGSYGCSFCLRRGMRIDRGNGGARVYAGIVGRPRTIVQHLDAIEALEEYNRTHRKQKKHVEGVNNTSVLLTLRVFNLATSFVPDYLHCVLEGVVKQFINHWCNGQHKEEDWYLDKPKRTLLSERLKAIMPPVEVTRAPRGLEDLKLFKASEFKNFLLYYSLVCLKGILPDKYLRHWFLLVFAISMYLKDSFTAEEFAKAKQALSLFVSEIDTVYPDCIHLYTFNVHLLLHIPRAVENFGGLWASSTFPYEHFNGVLANLITGSRTSPEQVCRSYYRLRHVSALGSRVFTENCSPRGKLLYEKLLSKFRSSQFSEQINDQLRLFGSADPHQLSLVERIAAQQLIGEGPIARQASSFRRMIFGGTVYHSSFYEALKARNNSIVQLNCGRVISITRIVTVEVLRTHERKCVVIGEQFDEVDETLCQYQDIQISSKDVVRVYRRTNRITSVFPASIYKKCVIIPYRDLNCIVPLVNLIERD